MSNVDHPGELVMDVASPTAFAHGRPATHDWPVLGALDRWFSDKRYNISRPKVLFAVSMIDFVIILATGMLLLGISGSAAVSVSFVGLIMPLAVATFTVMVLSAHWAYTIQSLGKAWRQLEKLLRSLGLVFCLVFGASAIFGFDTGASEQAAAWLISALLLTGLLRFAVATVLAGWARQGRLVRRAVIVGGGQDAAEVIKTFRKSGEGSVQLLGLFDDRDDDRGADSISGVPKIGNFDQLAGFCRNAAVDLIVVTVPYRAEDRLLQIMKCVMPLPVEVRISALNSKLPLDAKAYRHICGVPMLAVMDRPLSDWDRMLKNIEDRVLGTLLLLMLSPVMALVALAVRLDSRGPIFFKQRRYGFNNELIEVWKFRSMYVDKSDATASQLVTKNDPRVTRVGAIIRKTSLDELPQLINVVMGEMSLVGPRPHATQAKADGALYQTVVQSYFARHRVKPGITGWAQINGWRGETDTHEKIERRVEYDLEYIDNWSILFDLYVIARTPTALLSAKNAY